MSESAIFNAAVKLSPDQRAAYLDQACGANPELRHEVESLLHAHDASDSFLRDPPARSEATADYEPITERPGTVIGPYKLMEQIGEGAFGLVFVAEQEQPLRRKVAVKVIKPGMDTREVIARFEAERQALALMDHPNIAKILDAGSTDSGRPYFVMELVKGMPITDYCDQNQFTPRERLELFTHVCQAVQHAHQKGVVHRDLKPSNVLVAPHDGAPVVKVIDFGIAKALGQQLTDKTVYTRLAQMIGTPLYMSPEQAEVNALDVDTRSDVYALGVLLYELLTGTTPFDGQRFRKAAFDEIRRIIREEEPPKPSTRLSTLAETLSAVSARRKTEPRKLSGLVKGDLDWIVMKALEKDRARRYETASAFAADVRHFLHEEPVDARPPSAWYRFHKLARRNKVALTTATLVAAALLLGATVSAWQAVRATAAAQEAREAQHQAEADRDRAEKAEAQAKADRDRAENERKASHERECYHNGLLAMEQGDYESAEKILQFGLSSARSRVGLGSIETQMIVWRLAFLFGKMNVPEKGELLLRELREIPKRQGQTGSAPTPYAITLEQLGRLLLQQRKWAEAEDVLRECVTIREQAGFFDQSGRFVAKSLHGASLVGQKKYVEAEPILHQAYEGLKSARDEGSPKDPKHLIPVPEAAERLVQLYDEWRKPDEAAKWRTELEVARKLAASLKPK